MPRLFGSPLLGNVVAARLPPDEIRRRSTAPLTRDEIETTAELVRWFRRRFPTAGERLAYARNKMREYERAAEVEAPGGALGDYDRTAKRLADAHRRTDPGTIHVMLARDPEEREIRLVEVTSSTAPARDPEAVRFGARPDLGVPFSSAVLLLSPEQWREVQARTLDLPPGWSSELLAV